MKENKQEENTENKNLINKVEESNDNTINENNQSNEANEIKNNIKNDKEKDNKEINTSNLHQLFRTVENKDEINENNKQNEEINSINNNKENEIKEDNINNINPIEEKNEIKSEQKENEIIIITKDEGIKKRILKEGTGINPKEGNEVSINYIGKFGDKIFEQTNENEPLTFIIGENKVLKGFELAVQTMKLGERAEFIMKSEYTYQDKQINEDIPINSILTYEIELKCIHYKNTEESLENLTYGEKLQWGKLLKQNGVEKFKENDIPAARECFVKALSFLKTMNPEKEEEKEGVDLFLTILANICNCYNKEKDYDSVIKYAFIGINIKPTLKLLYFRTIALSYLEEFDDAEKDFKNLIELFKSNGEENNQEIDDTINYLRTLIDSRKKIFEEKNKIFSRAIYRQLFHNNKNIKEKILVPSQTPNLNNPFVFLEIQIGEKNVGKIEIELFKDVVPITVENFRNLCIGTQDGLSYKNSCFNKLIKNFVLGGGELENISGENKCIYGKYFDDENYIYGHCRRGLLTMDNDGKNKNNSKFFILLNHIPWFDGKHVVFGQIINGMEIIKQIEEIETDKDDKPLINISIINCGKISNNDIIINIKPQEINKEEKEILENNDKTQDKNEIIIEQKDKNENDKKNNDIKQENKINEEKSDNNKNEIKIENNEDKSNIEQKNNENNNSEINKVV